MKKLLLLLLIIPLTSFNSNNQTTDFVGKWLGDENGEIGYIIFDKEGYASFEIEGQVLGGKEFEMNGEKGKMTYKVNNNTDPIEVDFTLTKLETGEQKQLFCIAKFIDADSMMFAMSFDEARPSNFDGDTTIILKRVE
mgnify:FL=1